MVSLSSEIRELGEKRQTIRLARKHRIKEGDKLYLYWKLRTKQCEKIGEAICTESYRVSWYEIASANRMAMLDGFDTLREYQNWFNNHYHPTEETKFDVIRWEELKLPEEAVV